jgi:hypothetical protein
MGPGIVDARALLAADIDVGLRLSRAFAGQLLDPGAADDASVASLVAETVGADAVDDELDWHRYGPEIATALLGKQLDNPDMQPGALAAPAAPAVTEQLAGALGNPWLRDRLGLG